MLAASMHLWQALPAIHPMYICDMQVNFQPGNLAFIDDMELELLQFHFHAPSEHAMDGKRYAMEVHLVHKNKSTGVS